MGKGLKWNEHRHKEAFEELIQQSYMSQKELDEADDLLRRQLAFLYIISAFQVDYEKYEGISFWVDQGEVLSLDGPTYLLDDKIGIRNYPHERVLIYAKQVLEGQLVIELANEDRVHQRLIEQAIQIARVGIA